MGANNCFAMDSEGTHGDAAAADAAAAATNGDGDGEEACNGGGEVDPIATAAPIDLEVVHPVLSIGSGTSKGTIEGDSGAAPLPNAFSNGADEEKVRDDLDVVHPVLSIGSGTVRDGDSGAAPLPNTFSYGAGVDEEKACNDQDEEEQDDDDSTAPNFVDHFSLGAPSSTVRFRNARVRLYGDIDDQFILEDRPPPPFDDDGGDGDDDKAAEAKGRTNQRSGRHRHTITVKRVKDNSFALLVLRAAYTLVAFLVVGFLFVFCFQLILFLFMNMATTQSEDKVGPLIGAILSVPIFLHGMASIMAIGGTFAVDTWNRNALLRSVTRWPILVTDWICFVVFIGVPSLSVSSTLLAGRDDWWEVSALVWVCCVFALGFVFAFAVVRCEVGACFKIVGLSDDGGDDRSSWRRWVRLARRAIMITQIHFYSGTRQERFLVNGSKETPKMGYSSSTDHSPIQTRIGLYSRLTRLPWCSSKFRSFDVLDPPIRSYTMEEVRDILPFVTAQNWSVGRLFSGNHSAQMIAVVQGSSALRPNQIKSSVACTALGATLIVLLIVAVLSWFTFPAVMILVVCILIYIFCLFPIVLSTVRIWRMYNSLTGNGGEKERIRGEFSNLVEESGHGEAPEGPAHQNQLSSPASNDNDNVTMFQVWETVRITQPRSCFCWTMFAIEFVFLFVLPLSSLYYNGQNRIGTVFLFLGGISVLRLYFNAGAVLSEFGSLNNIDPSKIARNRRGNGEGYTDRGEGSFSHWYKKKLPKITETEEERILSEKARISKIVGKISRGRSVQRWMWLFGGFVVIVLFMFLSAVTEDSFDYKVKGVVPAEGFYYPPQEQLRYPTCQLKANFSIPGEEASSLGDYAYLAALGFAGPGEAQDMLDTWFGPGEVVDEHEFVKQYRIDTDTVDHPVSYKLFSFPNDPGYGVVSIRGSEAMADWLVDIQLWSCAALVQTVRALIPLGWIWTPIFDELVYIVNSLQSDTLKEVSYYRFTTKFVQDLKAGYGGGQYHTLRVTGASLGGGLAIITGAQTGASTVAISGLNAMLSRRTFDPPVTKEDLDTRTFNVIPDRDIIARIDDRAQLFQETQCRAPKNSLFGCHSMWRSVCEIAYQCGSGDRPILCWCVSKYGYPEPSQSGSTTWADACANA